jgi:3-dehydroquinate synthase
VPSRSTSSNGWRIALQSNPLLENLRRVDTIVVALGDRSYPIHIGPELLTNTDLYGLAAKQVLIVTNEVVAPLYLQRVQTALRGHEVDTVVLPDGERHKTLATFTTVIDRLIDGRFHRDCCLVALGGGVIGDLTGYVAASYQRGVDFVQIPTTLLAQVDSSVGGKTAVNHPRAKNMIGAFHQPIAVLADTLTLRSLPPRELAAGLAEVIKYGVIVDEAFFAWLESHIDDLRRLDAASLTYAIRRSCEIKAAIVAEDEREQGRRALLNLGHTFGHALEAIGHYERWLHGEAVGIGMALAARTSVALGWLGTSDCERIETLLTKAGLPTTASGIDPDEMLDHMRGDKKADRSGLKLILIRALGESVVTRAPAEDTLRAVLAEQLE